MYTWAPAGMGKMGQLPPQIYIIVPDAVPPIHTESYHVATDKDPSK